MDIIKSSEEISLIFREGKRVSLPDIRLIIKELPPQRDRLGRVAFIAGKKQGNAVWRNHAKRRMRALYRDISLHNNAPLENYDVLFIAQRYTNRVSYQQLYTQLQKGVKQLSKDTCPKERYEKQ